jgi:uncharacterized protein
LIHNPKHNPTKRIALDTATLSLTGSVTEFRAPWFLNSGHLQTLITGFYKPKCRLRDTITHRVPIGQHGHMLIHENRPRGSETSRRAIFLLHGMGSCARGTYMSRVASALQEAGERVFRFDLPGAGESYRHTPLPPHGACADLVWQSIRHLSDTCGIDRWRGAGVSLGGNILLKIVAKHTREAAQDQLIEQAVAVAPPVDLAACCRNMERPMHRIYAFYFLRSLKTQTQERARLWPQWRERLDRADFSTIRAFDDTVTSQLAGFADANDYYQSGSTIDELDRISIPCQLLLDRHDPIVPFDVFSKAKLSATTTVATTNRGGHVGYLTWDAKRPVGPTHGLSISCYTTPAEGIERQGRPPDGLLRYVLWRR